MDSSSYLREQLKVRIARLTSSQAVLPFLSLYERASLVQCVLVANSPFDSRSLRNAVNPLEHVWKGLHVFLTEARESPTLDPGPGANIGNRVFAFAVTGQVIARLAGILATQLNLEDAVDTEGFVAETFDCVCGSGIASTCYTSLGGEGGGVWYGKRKTGYTHKGSSPWRISRNDSPAPGTCRSK